jgi:tRNA-dihydrouridine synthase
MVGLAAVKQPWIFASANGDWHQCQPPTPATIIGETGLRFLELLARYQPPEFHLSRARRFFGFFCDNLKWGNYLKNQLNREESLMGIEKAWHGYFEKP